jgi:hypothetical protein
MGSARDLAAGRALAHFSVEEGAAAEKAVKCPAVAAGFDENGMASGAVIWVVS